MRARRAPRPPLPRPGPEELAKAARELHRELTFVVGQLDKGRKNHASDADTWEGLKFAESPPRRGGITFRPTVLSAVGVVAERLLDKRARLKGWGAASAAIAVVRGRMSPDDAIRQSRRGRAQTGDLGELKGAVSRARSERQKWKAAYNVLAGDVDVWPAPDTRSGLRGPLRDLYEAVARLR